MGELDRRACNKYSFAIGPGNPVFIVAEVGTTANGDLETALKLIEAAYHAGADAVKFQMINPDEFMSDKTISYEYESAEGKRSENMYEMFKKLMFTQREWTRIKERCDQLQIAFYTSIDNIPDITLAEKLGCPMYKISSWDLRNYPLLKAVARTGKPVQVDLGPAILGEVIQVCQAIEQEGNDKIILVHCSHAKDPADINLRTIPYLQESFDYPVGYSADSRDFTPDLVAVGLGVNMLEKRLTLDMSYQGHHHTKALEQEEFGQWVTMVRMGEAMRGELAIKPSLEDLRMKMDYFTSIVFRRDVEAGEVITEEMLAARRPGAGISPFYMNLFIGRLAARDFKENEILPWDAV